MKIFKVKTFEEVLIDTEGYDDDGLSYRDGFYIGGEGVETYLLTDGVLEDDSYGLVVVSLCDGFSLDENINLLAKLVRHLEVRKHIQDNPDVAKEIDECLRVEGLK